MLSPSRHPTPQHNARFFWIVSLAVLLLTLVPFLWADKLWDDRYVFGGFLFNPIDGNTYLAKMYQGWEGNWRFSLPFSAESGEGEYLFLFYLLLGQIARETHLDLLGTFHLARAAGALLMLGSMWRFFSVSLKEPPLVKTAFALAAFGSGMGWLASLFGAFTADLWVAEAFPFLSAYANPHFPIGLALMLWVVTPDHETNWPDRRYLKVLITGLVGVMLGLVLPFGVFVAGSVLAGLALWQILENRRLWISSYISRLAWFLAGALPVLIYDLWAIATNPALRGWNAQNLTPSPSPFDFSISFLPVLIFGIPGAISILKNNQERQRVLLIWCAVGVALLYLPISLQRRLMLGMMVPFAGLSVLGLGLISRGEKMRFLILTALLFTLAIPTNLVVLLAGVHGVQTHDSTLYLTQSESQAFDWLAGHTPEDALILAAPETGLLIPAYTGRRVIYGHPFETLQADDMEALVVRLLKGTANTQDLNIMQKTDYVFWGPREARFGQPIFLENFEVVFQIGDVTILKRMQ